MQLPGDISTCGGTAGVFAQPRPEPDMDRTEILQCSSLVVRVLSSEWQRRRSARFRAIQNNHTSPRLMAGLLRHRGEAGPILVNTCCDALYQAAEWLTL